jgi:hypothetical protein
MKTICLICKAVNPAQSHRCHNCGTVNGSGASTYYSALSEAMQDVWNDHCSDTGCHPDCVIATREGIKGSFLGSVFANRVESLLESRGYVITKQNAPDHERKSPASDGLTK